MIDRLPGLVLNLYDRHMLNESAKYFLNPCGDEGTFLDRLTSELFTYTEVNPAVLVGFGAQMIYAGRKDTLHIRIIAEKSARIMRAGKQFRVLIIEDIIRSGLTTGYLLQNLETRGAASIGICTLLLSPSEQLISIPVQYIGFEVSKTRLLGYGLDVDEKGRNLPYIVEIT